ncbi:MAG TPA: hypothetical protein VM536_18600 [Chloroflexia bacterium]|nr:hypothetical protein [Chloroflexia bacterium]
MPRPRIPTLNPDEVDADMRAIFERFLAQRGNIPNMFRTMAYRPSIMKTAEAHMAAVLNQGTVPTALKELCVVRVSHLNSCAY